MYQPTADMTLLPTITPSAVQLMLRRAGLKVIARPLPAVCGVCVVPADFGRAAHGTPRRVAARGFSRR